MLGYKEILELGGAGVITPFTDKQVRDGVISYGMSGAGYDFRLGTSFLRPANPNEGFGRHRVLDPKRQDSEQWVEFQATNTEPVYLFPGDFILGVLEERLNLPNNILILFIGKSTYARVGLIANVTPAEPGWKGHLTVELTNPHRDHVIVVYPGEGILQGLFFRTDSDTLAPYNGKYQDQPDTPVSARLYKDG